MSSVLTIIGLCLDTVGVVVLFYSGLPVKHFENSVLHLNADPDKKEREMKNKSLRFWSHFALALLVVGFLFQIVSAVIVDRPNSTTDTKSGTDNKESSKCLCFPDRHIIELPISTPPGQRDLK